MKVSFVAIVGRPSAGKSTLLNTLCGYKISITTPVPQTTRNKVRGILTNDTGQLIFIDTPGYHLSDKKFNQHMTGLVASALEEVDLVLYTMDGTRKPGAEEEKIAAMLAPFQKRLVIVCNKVDVAQTYLQELRTFAAEHLPQAEWCELSALTGEGVENLKEILFRLSPEGELLYPDSIYTDQDPEFRASEIIREKALQKVREEIPHALYVDIDDMEIREPKGREKEQTLWIRGYVIVERDSQKGIVIGKDGSNIKAIRQESQKELADIFPYHIHLDLRVKVNHKWRKKDPLLRRLIH